ncbi:MAG TPA: YbaN family protein [Pyrinomonadaceae bacterium]|nr:YbaN family protein [Pyrinomonadaceae bacterium]HLE61540.1 YbaN family protein [Pyrinomonadaceae bacterium]
MFARVLLNILGTIFLFFAVLGIILPLLPATPFLLLSSACYVRGSRTLHNWLMNQKYLGPYITNIKTKRGMPLKAKLITITILWASLLFSIYRADSLLLDSALVLVGIGVTTLILKLKTVDQKSYLDLKS